MQRNYYTLKINFCGFNEVLPTALKVINRERNVKLQLVIMVVCTRGSVSQACHVPPM